MFEESRCGYWTILINSALFVDTTFFVLFFSQVWLGLFPITEYFWVNMLTWIWWDSREYLFPHEHFLYRYNLIGSISLFILKLHSFKQYLMLAQSGINIVETFFFFVHKNIEESFGIFELNSNCCVFWLVQINIYAVKATLNY